MGKESAKAQLELPKLRVTLAGGQVEQVFHTIHIHSHTHNRPKYTYHVKNKHDPYTQADTYISKRGQSAFMLDTG